MREIACRDERVDDVVRRRVEADDRQSRSGQGILSVVGPLGHRASAEAHVPLASYWRSAKHVLRGARAKGPLRDDHERQ